MSPSTQLTSEQLKKSVQDDKKTDQGARNIQEEVEYGEGVLDSDNTISVLSTVLNTMSNEFKHQFLDAAVRLLNAHSIHPSIEDHVPDHKYSIPSLGGT
jgi:hypothetical protein